MRHPRVMIAGKWKSAIHEEPLYGSFMQAGCSVSKFKWHPYLDAEYEKGILKKICVKLEQRLSQGKTISRINDDLIRAVKENTPDILILYRPQFISSRTIKRIKSINSKLVVCCYNNDDPFSTSYPWYYWRVFQKSICEYDFVFAYREKNIPEFYEKGAKKVIYLPSWYVPSLNYPDPVYSANGKREYIYDIVFIGHYENDGRIEYIRSLVEAGLKVGLYGPEWNHKIKNDRLLKKFFPVKYLYIEDSNRVLSSSKMALVIYSKLNNDQYTRRCFEIPSTGTMMLAKRTEAMEGFYSEDKEVVFFDDCKEMVQKALFYSGDISKCESIGSQGMARAKQSGYDVNSRVSYILDSLAAN
ncbi:MAG: hypothetical protein CL784_03570 [Chloroflexi bacterium]|nr:hypothetical protein [Chloroflexota bacterium]